jgi:hypothetical protein
VCRRVFTYGLTLMHTHNNTNHPFNHLIQYPMEKEIKNAKDYQLRMCVDRMRDLSKDCADNLTQTISRSVYHLCNEELVKRGQPAE